MTEDDSRHAARAAVRGASSAPPQGRCEESRAPCDAGALLAEEARPCATVRDRARPCAAQYSVLDFFTLKLLAVFSAGPVRGPVGFLFRFYCITAVQLRTNQTPANPPLLNT
jgi:hypothetical protein